MLPPQASFPKPATNCDQQTRSLTFISPRAVAFLEPIAAAARIPTASPSHSCDWLRPNTLFPCLRDTRLAAPVCTTRESTPAATGAGCTAETDPPPVSTRPNRKSFGISGAAAGSGMCSRALGLLHRSASTAARRAANAGICIGKIAHWASTTMPAAHHLMKGARVEPHVCRPFVRSRRAA